MRHASICLTTIVTLTAAAAAQRSVVLPAEYERAWGRSSSSALGSNISRTQIVFAQPFATGTPLFGVGMRCAASTVDRAAWTADVEIQVSSSTATPGALSSTFASNIGSDMVIALPRQTVTIPAMAANRSTGEFVTFTFPTPFLFGLNSNTNLVVDLFVYNRSTGASWSTDRAFASTSGRATTAGIGCGSATISSTSTGGTYVGGSLLSISLAAAPANSLAMLLPSFDQMDFAPGVPLPFDLSLFGAASNCRLLVRPGGAPLVTLTDGAGAGSLAVTVPVGLGQFGVGWQWLYPVPSTASNPLGLEVTASRSTWIGPEVVIPNAQYVYSLSSTTAATGTATVDSVPVMQFIIP